jgi:hypothetical protein
MRGGRPDQKVGLAALDVKLQDPFGVLGDQGCKQQFYVVHRMDSGKNAPLPHHSFG